MSALRRVVGAPGLLLGLWLVELAVAAGLAQPVRIATAAAMNDHAFVDESRVIYGLLDLFALDPGAAAAPIATTLVVAALAALGWTAVTGGIIARLAGTRPARDCAAIAVRSFLPLLAVSGWHLLMRAGLLALLGLSISFLPGAAQGLVFATGLAVCGWALALARTAVVLEERSGIHPRTAALAWKTAVMRPSALAVAVGVGLAQTLVLGGQGWLLVTELGSTMGLVGARALGLLGIALGLWRLALAVETATPPADRPRA